MKNIALERKTVLNGPMNMTQKKWPALSLMFTLIAIGLHFYLTQKYFALKFGVSGEVSFCNINSYLNCDAVSASRFSSFLGRPMALWGLVTNIVFFTVQLFSYLGWFSNPRRGQIFAFLFSLFIGLVSLVMGFISLTQLSKVCLFCAATYFLSWGSLAIWFALVKPKTEELIEFISSLFTTGKSTLGFIIAIPFFAWILNTAFLESSGVNQNLEPLIQEKIAAWKNAPTQTFDLKAGLLLGKENSSFTIVEFADFRCPHCKLAYPTLHAFAQAHPEVQFVFKTFPLDGTCNPDPAFHGEGDGISCRLALGVICSDKVLKKGWDLHHFIFEHQNEFQMLKQTEKVDQKMCEGIGADCTALKTCMDASETMNELKSMSQEAIKAQIGGTPTIFINGKLLQGAQILPILEAAFSQSN